MNFTLKLGDFLAVGPQPSLHVETGITAPKFGGLWEQP